MSRRRVKLCLSRLLQSCRSDDPVSLPSNRHRSRSFLISCGCGSRSSHVSRAGPQEFQWKQETDFHVVVAAPTSAPRRKVYSSSASNEAGNSPVPPLLRRKRRPRTRKRISASFMQPISTSSDDSGLFSSEDINYGGEHDHEDEAAEMLPVSSSRSCSTDTTYGCIKKELNASEKKKSTEKTMGSRRSRARAARGNYNHHIADQPALSSPARLSAVFRRLAPSCGIGTRLVLEGPPAAKVRESYAVVKRSECPYEDFKGSMMEMIVEKEMFEEGDLEQLLLCFLSLNSSCHHGAIVAAFSVIWEALVGCRS